MTKIAVHGPCATGIYPSMPRQPVPEEQRRRAGQAVQQRMTELAATTESIAARAGVSANTVRSLVQGKRWPTVATRAAIESALGWPLGELAQQAHGTTGPPNLADVADVDLAAELLRRIQSNGDPKPNATLTQP